jgi:hypothetical protein
MIPNVPNNAALVMEDTVEVVTVEIMIPRIFQPYIPERGILRNKDQEQGNYIEVGSNRSRKTSQISLGRFSYCPVFQGINYLSLIRRRVFTAI